jgi:hypothetical protein
LIATAATLAGARRLHVVAGLAAFLAMLANVDREHAEHVDDV